MDVLSISPTMRTFLTRLIATFKRKPRYRPDIEWSDKSLIHNSFRGLEWLFGREIGIRKEAASWVELQNGEYIIKRKFYTLEAYLAHFETGIRAYFNFDWSSLFFNPNIDYQRGAIALDTANNGTATGTTPLTWSHTCTGSNLILFISPACHAASPTLSTPTYNSVSATIIQSTQVVSTVRSGLWMLVGPASGANTVSVGFGGTTPSCNAAAVSYSGAAQSGQPDSSNVANNTSANPSVSTTVVASNCWLVGFCNALSTLTAGQTVRWTGTVTNSVNLEDSNATVGTGSQSMSWTASLNSWAAISASFSPAVAITTAMFMPFFPISP